MINSFGTKQVKTLILKNVAIIYVGVWIIEVWIKI